MKILLLSPSCKEGNGGRRVKQGHAVGKGKSWDARRSGILITILHCLSVLVLIILQSEVPGADLQKVAMSGDQVRR